MPDWIETFPPPPRTAPYAAEVEQVIEQGDCFVIVFCDGSGEQTHVTVRNESARDLMAGLNSLRDEARKETP